MNRFVKKKELFPIYLQLDQDDSAQFPQAVIIDEDGVITSTLNLDPVPGVDGKYLKEHSFLTVGDFSIKFIIYSDSARTKINPKYRRGDLTVRVTNLEENVETLLDRSIRPIAVFD